MANHQFALVDDRFRDYRSSHIRVKVAANTFEKQGYFHLRKQTFHHEQQILPATETDAEDFRAIAIIALSSSWSVADDVVGAVRIFQDRQEPNTWYGGRLCVAREYRGHKQIGKALINEAVSRAIDLGCQRFLAKVQIQNEKYFKSVHWQTIEYIEVLGKPHALMQAELSAFPFMPRDQG